MDQTISPENKGFVAQLFRSQNDLQSLLRSIDPAKKLYPAWGMKELVSHIIGWDLVMIAIVEAFIRKIETSFTKIDDFDAFNATEVAKRKDLDIELVLKEWTLTRQILGSLVEQIPSQGWKEEFPVPWGGKASVTDLIEILISHEQYHAKDITSR